ncbi:MAG: hypothetical protein COT73_08900 [Bdellovibrio sp. CG10_big_fil_rev_8_21_14_0_10_47_8]|nr:MAG: hypothetical protein COT73_08900 [Bdellovibrio sp. CG10_big_fil_rev_8_21_14_0_10_47_8]
MGPNRAQGLVGIFVRQSRQIGLTKGGILTEESYLEVFGMSQIWLLIVVSFLMFTACSSKPLVADYVSDPIFPVSSKRQPTAEGREQWWTASEKQVLTAVCRKSLPTSDREIQQYFQNLPKDPSFEPGGVITVSGITFKNEREDLIEAFSMLMSKGKEDEKPEVPPLVAERFKQAKTCSKVLCAVKNIFGAQTGPKMLFLMHRFSINTSPYSWTHADLFYSAELDDVIRSLELLPEGQLPFSFNQKLIRFKRGFTRVDNSPNVVANASIELFDSWTEHSSAYRQYTLFHEFAHNAAYGVFGNLDGKKEWLKTSPWDQEIMAKYLALKQSPENETFVSGYAKTNPWEDFAESSTAYRFNPELLKKDSMDKYKYIRYLSMNGREYNEVKDCQKETSVEKLQKSLKQKPVTFTMAEKKAIQDNCELSFSAILRQGWPASFFRQCVNFEATIVWKDKVQTEFPDIVPNEYFDTRLKWSRFEFPALVKELRQQLAQKNAQWFVDHISPKRSCRDQPKMQFVSGQGNWWYKTENYTRYNYSYGEEPGVVQICTEARKRSTSAGLKDYLYLIQRRFLGE